MDLNDIKLKPNPFLKANPISKLLFLWVIPFLWKGSKKDLNLEDIPKSIPSDASEKLGNFVEKEWENQVKRAKDKAEKGENKPPKLWRVIRKLIWKRYIIVGIGYSFDELCLRVAQPIVLRHFIKTFNEDEKSYPNLRRDQYLYAGALVLLTLVHAILFQSMISITINLGMKVRLGISSLIYRKILRLRKADSESTNVGRLCNMLASDVSRFDQGFFLLHFFYICPLQVILYCYLLWLEIGWACFGGVGCIVCILPFQVLVGRLSAYFRTRIARRTDKRGNFLNEILSGIRLIKMYAWEKPFCAVISKLRVFEIQYIRRGLYLRGAFVSIHFIAQKLIPFCVLILYVGLGNTLTAEKAFYVIAVFNILQTIMNRLPNGASQLGEMIASANRVEMFLASSESDAAKNQREFSKTTSKQNGNISDDLKNDNINEKSYQAVAEPTILFENYTAGWTENQETLKDLQVNIKGNKLVMIVGHVGSGKTSFLNAILSELPIIKNGSCSIHGTSSYASQEGWIFPGTVRQNILFGLDMDQERYWSTIKLCCLQDDLKQFPDGDLTLVGERGVSLSGGQKARVNLARAIYQKSDIYLFDDPLSAVDSKVSRLLFDELIVKQLRGKMRILVSHQLQYLPAADHIIVLTREGTIWFQGTYDELKKSTVDFTSLISDKYMHTETDIDEMLQEEPKDANTSGIEKSNEKLDDDKAESIQNCKGETRNLLTGAPVGRIKDEEKRIGSIGLRTYLNYFKSGNSYCTMIFILLSFIACQLFFNALDYWLGLWTNSVTQEADESTNNFSMTVSNGSEISDMNLTSIWSDLAEKQGISEDAFFAYVYCGMMGIFISLTIFRSILFFRYCMKISINLHDSMFGSLVRAPVKFFDDNPSGRIMNRFTKDLNNVDELLPVSFYDFINIFLALLGMLTINIIANYFIAVPAVILLIGLAMMRRFYLATTRDLKRIEALAKSPMFTHVTMTAQGLTTIRALQASNRVLSQFETIQDTHTATFFMSFVTSRWFAMWLEILSCMFMCTVCFGFLVLPSSLISAKSGSVGMALSAILNLAGSLQWGIRQSAETENYMTSVERVFEYCNLKSEAPLEYGNDTQVKQQNWPQEGRIEFHSVCLSYDEENLENKVLNEVTFSTNPHEKIGIVGRTGAGKSSLIQALFRLTEMCDGEISIDNIPIQDLGLHILRSRMSIIPQDPVIFSGNIRENLSPFNEYSDDQLWRALSDVGLNNVITSLDYKVDHGGSNFSTGQKQLVCLARAILRKNKIIILDEPSSNIDMATDEMIQKTIRSKFSDCTILTIAHRLQTVLDSDRILVMDAGRVVEFDKPEVLAANPNSVFSSMLQQSNAASAISKR